MKKIIISVIIMLTIISLPVLSQSGQNASVDIHCLGSSLILPDWLPTTATDMGTIPVYDPADWYTLDVPVEIVWTFKGDGTVPVHHVMIQHWDQEQDADLNNGEKIEIESHWFSDGMSGVEARSNTAVNTSFEVVLSNPTGGFGSPSGCDSEGKIYLKITRAMASSHFPTNRGPIVFTFVIAALD